MAGADQRRWGWGRPAFFERVGREVRAARETAALIDMTSFGKTDVSGPGACALLQRLAAANIDKPVGGLTYTQFLNPAGGIESDVTVCRLGTEQFRIISGTSFVANDLGWITTHLPGDGSVEVVDVTEIYGCLSLCGPRARQILAAATPDDVSNAGFAYMTAAPIHIDDVAVWAQRISYSGELGWELYMAAADGPAVFTALMAAGADFGLQPIGYKALESLRIEKGFLYWSGDITPEDNPLEAGLGFAVDFDKGDFIGREALLQLRANGLKTRLCALTMDARHGLFGGESVYHNGTVVDRVRSAAFGHTIGKDIALLYLPLELARPGTALEVEVLGERLAAEVAALPLVDPEGKNVRA